MKTRLFISLILSITLGLGFQPARAATLQTAAGFMDLCLGPRPIGMGRAFTAISNDLNAPFFNPAGLASQKRLGLSLNGTNHQGVSVFRSGVSLPVAPVTLAFNYLDVGKDGLSQTELDAFQNPYFTGNTYAYSAKAVYASAAWPLNPFMDMGVSVKLLQEKISTFSGSGFGADVGVLYRPFYFDVLQLGVFVENLIQPEMKWNYVSTDKQVAPRKYRGGIALKLWDGVLTTALDASVQETRPTTFYAGVEYWLHRINIQENQFLGLAFRGGVYSIDKNNLTAFDKTMGQSLGLSFQYYEMVLDYAYTYNPYSELENTQQVALSFLF